MKTALITGASKGIGKAAAIVFADAGWNVAATMRQPDGSLFSHPNIRIYQLDVTDASSIRQAFQSVLNDFGRIDVVVNNAGFGVDGIFETIPDDVIRSQFETNVFGLMNVSRQAIAHMRMQGGGTIIQVASMAGRLSFPLYSIYHASKWAVEGFTESLQYELRSVNIRLRIIEPGIIRTNFFNTSRVRISPSGLKEYQSFYEQAEKVTAGNSARAVDPAVVGRIILRAAESKGRRLRFAAGYPAPVLLLLRRLLPQRLYEGFIRLAYGLK